MGEWPMHRRVGRNALLAILASAALIGAAVQAAENEPSGAPPESIRWFTEARFGMFIHWGIYSLLGRGEWVMHHEKIPVKEYEKLQKRFNPTRFDARKWVSLAKRAGMRYITFTSKHHDGFCMFDSALTKYTSMYAPCKRDFVAELTRECQRQGLGIFYYYSLLDWHHPDYRANLPAYVEYAHGQVRELCTKYGRISGIWFDGGWEHSAEEWRSPELIAMIRKLQPHALVNDRARWDGDFGTPEQRIPPGAAGKGGRLFECCFTINRSWGYSARDRNFKSAAQLVQMLADIVGRGGNLLLNVGPLPTGEIPEEQAFRLRQVGEWMDKYGASIYGCSAGPFPKAPWGACTTKGTKLYLHLFQWPGREMEIVGLQTRVRRAYCLKGKAEVKFRQTADQLRLRLPEIAPDLMDTVIVLELSGSPKVEWVVRQGKDGVIALSADMATIHGEKARVETKTGPDGKPRSNIGYWTAAGDWVSWEVVVTRAGDYEAEVEWANEKGTGGSRVLIKIGTQELEFIPKDTGGWDQFQKAVVGRVRLKSGRVTVEVRPQEMKSYAVTNLRCITLRPVE